MPCESCPSPVPVVSLDLARRIAVRVQGNRLKVLVSALEWLVMRHEGLKLFLGVNGRHYTDAEKRAIAPEFAAVEASTCPFVNGDDCLLDRLPEYNRPDECNRAPYLWLPTAMAKLLDEGTFREMVRRKEIADAKVSMLSRNEALY